MMEHIQTHQAYYIEEGSFPVSPVRRETMPAYMAECVETFLKALVTDDPYPHQKRRQGEYIQYFYFNHQGERVASPLHYEQGNSVSRFTYPNTFLVIHSHPDSSPGTPPNANAMPSVGDYIAARDGEKDGGQLQGLVYQELMYHCASNRFFSFRGYLPLQFLQVNLPTPLWPPGWGSGPWTD